MCIVYTEQDKNAYSIFILLDNKYLYINILFCILNDLCYLCVLVNIMNEYEFKKKNIFRIQFNLEAFNYYFKSFFIFIKLCRYLWFYYTTIFMCTTYI